jgi:hypothetical protein
MVDPFSKGMFYHEPGSGSERIVERRRIATPSALALLAAANA